MLVMMAVSVCTGPVFPELPALQFVLGSVLQGIFFFAFHSLKPFRGLKLRSSSYNIFLGLMVLGYLGTFVLVFAVINIGPPPCFGAAIPTPQILKRVSDYNQTVALFQGIAFATDIMTVLFLAIGSYIVSKEN